jgi:hypothetical protein
MHTETTTFATIVDQWNFQANFERWNGPDLSNSTFRRHRKLITDIEGTSPAFAFPMRIRLKQRCIQRDTRDWMKDRRVRKLTIHSSPRFQFRHRSFYRDTTDWMRQWRVIEVTSQPWTMVRFNGNNKQSRETRGIQLKIEEKSNLLSIGHRWMQRVWGWRYFFKWLIASRYLPMGKWERFEDAVEWWKWDEDVYSQSFEIFSLLGHHQRDKI